jgi:hypothetical protein
MNKIKYLVAIATFLIVIFAFAVPIYATDPPDDITIYSSKVVRNTVETGDMFFCFHWNLDYTAFPTEAASQTFSFRLYSADLSTLLAASTPYVYINNGYGQGVSGFYFSAAEVTSLGLVWGTGYIINVAASPAYFTTLPEPYYYTVAAGDYCSDTDQVVNKWEMKLYILSICDLLHIAYPTVVWSGTVDTGTVLSDIGELYFRGALPGISVISPTLFYTQFYVPTGMTSTYDDDLLDEYTSRLAGEDIMVGFDRLGAEFGLEGQTIAAFLVIILCIAFMIWMRRIEWSSEIGYSGAMIILTAGAILLGDALLVIRFIMALGAGIMLFWMVFLRKA